MSQQRIGIYGGGQLAAYLCEAARSLGMSSSVLAFTEDSMAVAYADRAIVAAADDLRALRALLACSTILTFDLEDVPAAVLEEIEHWQTTENGQVAPSVEVLRLLQNKYTQKQWLQAQGLPTAEFINCDEHVDAAALARSLGLPFVQKTHRGGYDGKGVQVVRDASGQGLWRSNAFAEKFISDKRELAVLVARNGKGETVCYPVVEMIFDEVGNVLLEARSPAAIEAAQAQAAQVLGMRVVEALEGVGIFAIEMFLTASGELLINEISPRVHNTGHLSMEAHTTSQYVQHLLAISGRALGDVTQKRPAVMRNILYDDALANLPKLRCGRTRWNQQTNVHWYGKSSGKALRKMGHITSLGMDLDAASAQAEATLDAFVQARGKAV